MVRAETWAVIGKGFIRSVLSLAILSCVCLLEVSLFAKLLAVFAWLWLQFTIQIFASLAGQAIKTLSEIQMWTRLTFVTVHIRNETDQLEPARDRMIDDLKLEAPTDSGIEGALGTIAIVWELVTTCIVLLAVLYVLIAQADLRQDIIGWLTRIAMSVGFLGNEPQN